MKPIEAPPPPGADPQWDAAWAELRELLVGPEREQIGAIEAKLGSRARQIEAVAEVLPPAVDNSARRGPELKRSLEPMVREVIEVTLKHDPTLLIDAALPVIGTLIRRYIAAALQDFVDAINIAQEKSMSVRSLQWRAESWRTGKPFAEVVLANSVLYRVEQVFLIHRKTGLLLLHRTAPGVAAKDADMISGMLTAIADFAHDSFESAQEHGELNTVQIGDLRIWVRHGQHAVLAAVVRGVAPPDLRALLDRHLAAIEKEWATALERYDGDSSPVAGADVNLRACLVGRGGAEPRSNRTLWIGASILLAMILLAGGLRWRDYSRWNAALGRLRAEPGYVVTEAKRGWLEHSIDGLRDPLAPPAESLLGSDAALYRLRFDPFVSLHPAMVARRDFEPKRERLEAMEVDFATDSVEVPAGALDSPSRLIQELGSMAGTAGARIEVDVRGGADPSGVPDRNRKLAEGRAEAVARALAGLGVDARLLRPLAGQERTRSVRFTVRRREGAEAR